MSVFDLTSVAVVKARLGLPSPPTPSDTTLSALVTASSRAIYAILSRPSILPQSYNETVDLESDRVFLSNWPVLSVSSVVLDGLVIPPTVPTDSSRALGYLLRPGDIAPPGRAQALDLFGRLYHRRRQSLIVGYQAGYAVENELWTIPTTTPFLLNAAAPFGAWASDLGVVYASSGMAMQPVAGAPNVGQYSVASGVYRFNASDAGAALSLSYGFVPQDLVEAATTLTAERFRAAEHIGVRSKSLGGQETIAYDLSGVSASVMALVGPYKRAAF